MSDPAERRRYPRFEVENLVANVQGFGTYPVLMLSFGGMLVAEVEEPPDGDEIEVTLPLPDGELRATARVVFVGPDLRSDGSTFRVGMAFEEPPPERRQALADYIEKELQAG